jgi:hypothetical protein
MLGPERRRRTKNIPARCVSGGFPGGNTLCAASMVVWPRMPRLQEARKPLVWVVNGEGGTYSHRVMITIDIKVGKR